MDLLGPLTTLGSCGRTTTLALCQQHQPLGHLAFALPLAHSNLQGKGSVICQFHCPGNEPGVGSHLSLSQEVSSRGNASSPKYLDAQNRYIVLGSPEQSSEKLFWSGACRAKPNSKALVKTSANKQNPAVDSQSRILPVLSKGSFTPKPRSLWSD